MNKLFSYAATETGFNHIKINKKCEDASDYYFDDENGLYICVVADGHGSDNYPRTDKGARFAVDAAIRCICDFVDNADADQLIADEENNYPLLTQLSKSILKEWYQYIEDDYTRNPISLSDLENVSDKYKRYYLSENPLECKYEKAYGCTLIAFAVTDKYSFGLQIGDGKCFLLDQNGTFIEPIPWDDNCQMNITTSICDSDAIDEFRFCVLAKTPMAVFCGSDGIDDSYTSTEELCELYRAILKIFIEHGEDVGKNEIREYLPVLTRKGSGDDVSLAMIIDLETITGYVRLLDIQSEIIKLCAALETKKKKIVILSDKMKATYKTLPDLSDRNAEELKGFYDIVDQFKILQKEVEDDEKRLEDLSCEQQEFIYDREAESFDEVLPDGDVDPEKGGLPIDTETDQKKES